MKLALCNEVIAQGRDFAAQCALAQSLGYEGLELAPFTLGNEPHLTEPAHAADLRRIAADHGLSISGLHWLLMKPDGLSITSADRLVRARTLDVMRGLVDLCAALGGEVLVHGSPAQRRLPDENASAARHNACELFADIAEHARRAEVLYCLEALATPAANFINTIAEAADIVTAIANPALRSMIDCSAATMMESEPLPALVARWLPGGMIAHVHVNDSNRRGPGQGRDRFAPLIQSLKDHAYSGWISVEPFDYVPDGATCAARAAGYMQGLIEAQT